jgi:NitT/TauT family transport system substrate-binding protein
MNFSTSQRVRKSQAAILATVVMGSLLVVASPASNAAVTVTTGQACNSKATVATAKNGKTVACKSGKWTEYKKAKLVFGAASASFAPKEEFAVYAVPKQLGYFAAENLEVSVVPTGGSIDGVNLVGINRIDITGSDLGSALSAIEKGGDQKVIGGLVMNFPWKMAVDPTSSIKKPEDLVGKKVGIVSTGSGSFPFAKAWLTGHGLKTTDVEYISLGGSIGPAQLALKEKRVDALAYYTSAYALEEYAGTKYNYLPTPAALAPVRSLSWIVNADAFNKNPEVYERFLRAAFKGLVYSSTNVKSATTLGYTELPVTLAGATIASSLGLGMASLKTWLESATPLTGTPSTWKALGGISQADWAVNQAYAAAAGTIVASVSRANYYDERVLARANTFDKKAVIDRANKAPK